MKKVFAKVYFLRKERLPQLLFIVVVLPLLVYLIASNNDSISEFEWWTFFLDPLLGIMTLAVALFVWWSEMNQEWEDKLPKLLTVEFRHEGKAVMVCENAYLAGESDIRQWAQQIGRQMNHGGNLSFSPFMDGHENAKGPEEINGKWYKGYHIVFYLEELPQKLGIPVGKVLLWNKETLRLPKEQRWIEPTDWRS